ERNLTKKPYNLLLAAPYHLFPNIMTVLRRHWFLLSMCRPSSSSSARTSILDFEQYITCAFGDTLCCTTVPDRRLYHVPGGSIGRRYVDLLSEEVAAGNYSSERLMAFSDVILQRTRTCDTLPPRLDQMVTGAHIHFTASHIQGSAGPLGTNAGHWHDVFLRYGAHSDRLQGFIATLVCHLTNNVVPWDDIYALMSCQLVALGKCPGVRPIGIGKTLRITCKTVRFLTRGRAPLVVKDSNEFLYSNKGVTQGDPLSMFIYAVATVSLIHHISHPNTVNPVAKHRIALSAQEFRDALAIRYRKPLLEIPPHCDGCNTPFDLSHALSCRKGGLVTQHHNEGMLLGIWPLLQLLKSPEPVVPELSGCYSLRGCLTSDTDAQSYSNRSPSEVLLAAEREKKRKYNQACSERRAQFTPLCVSLDGKL
uniref:Uncharacterized protein n=2 Tax=Amphimedon queenslandica TaxID=400682 RepID=A0A1X7ULL5_AMPQE